MAVLSELEPKDFFKYFEEISNIPRPSYKEEAISKYLIDFAVEHGLEHYSDEYNNVIIIKEATPGYEDKEPIIIQGHMDMVCEKEPGCNKDMEKEGLDLLVEGDIVSAKGTTLGADDGVAVCYGLSFLASDTLSHPRLEFVCTTAEETGMEGAHNIDLSPLRGRLLINIDSDVDNRLTAGCAGGVMAKVTRNINREEIRPGDVMLKISVSGLVGGHSGIEIHKFGANAARVIAECMQALYKKVDFRIVSLYGGKKDNVIPKESEAIISLPKDELDKAIELLEDRKKLIISEFDSVDKAMTITIEESKSQSKAVCKKGTFAILDLISSIPNGVQKMRCDSSVFVETSLNLGLCSLEEDKLLLGYCIRSSIKDSLDSLKEKVKFAASKNEATVTFEGEYPGWEYKEDSVLRERFKASYKKLFDKELAVDVVHAGLECGILGAKIDGIDAVSIGPNTYDIHTPAERLSIDSVQRVYKLLCDVISG